MKQPANKPEPKPTRGMPRSLLYAMIPLGFILIVVALIFLGVFTRETAEQPATVEPLSPANQTPADPSDRSPSD